MANPRRFYDWRHYAPIFSDLLVEYQINGKVRIGPMELSHARGFRTRFYHYKQYLWEACCKFDKGAREIYDLVEEIVTGIVKIPESDHVYLEFYTDPLFVAARAGQIGESAKIYANRNRQEDTPMEPPPTEQGTS